MTSFLAIDTYSPLLVLLIGLSTFIGFLGLGMWLQNGINLSLPSPWRQVVGVLLGIQTLSLIVQILGMLSLAFRPLLISIWLIMVASGGFIVFKEVQSLKPKTEPSKLVWGLFPLLVGLGALAVNLLVAIAPSTKHDETYYHMLLPSRIVVDSALNFYRLPWESAILPQMGFQISMAPLHALGFPDAANVVSWSLSLTLVWFGWFLLRERKAITAWIYIWMASIVVGMYPVVWHITGGAHAMGELATASVVVALLDRNNLIEKINVKAFSFLSSFLVLASVSSKVSLLPLGITILGFSLLFIIRLPSRQQPISAVLVWLLIPWVIFYLPILVWTFWQSGSPFGPMLAGFMGFKSVYDLQFIHSTFEAIKEVRNAASLVSLFVGALRYSFVYYSVLIYLGILSLFLLKNVPYYNRYLALFLVSLQTIIVVLVVQLTNLRFYGGLLYGVLIYFTLICPQKLQVRLTNSKLKILLITTFLLLPWFAVQTYYGSQFFPVSLGLQDKHQFYAEKTAFYQDYQELDKILPQDSILLVRGFRINSVYAPRPVYFDKNDLPEGKQLFLFQVNSAEVEGDYKIGKMVYQNDQAILKSNRTPGNPPEIGRLRVFELTGN